MATKQYHLKRTILAPKDETKAGLEYFDSARQDLEKFISQKAEQIKSISYAKFGRIPKMLQRL